MTLFATTLGVLLAFYLNDLSSRATIENRKQVSIKNLTSEMIDNESELVDSNDNEKLIAFLREIRAIDEKIPNRIITSFKTIAKLRSKHPDFMEIKDSSRIDVDHYEYNVSYKFELSLDNLQNIAWETSKMSGITNEMKYDCLQTLVEVYTLQEIYIKEQQKILNYFVNAEHNKLLSSLLIMQQLESQLLDVMRDGQIEIKNCN